LKTEGRGQQGNVWQSEDYKNLTFSIIISPNLMKVEQLYMLNVIVALAIRTVVEDVLGEEIYIKWPNDIYVRNKKVAGILVQNQFKADKKINTVIGIGLNVNQTSFPKELRASSLKLERKENLKLDDILQLLIKHFEEGFFMLNHPKGQEQLLNVYHQYLLGRGIVRNFRINQEIQQGEIIGINAQGDLMVKFETEIRSFGLKEIEYIFD
jgi:BirA family transcriptional regulator, biotin operon repressor / biotin---[acetyl-CoA-carboxylase] ligase